MKSRTFAFALLVSFLSTFLFAAENYPVKIERAITVKMSGFDVSNISLIHSLSANGLMRLSCCPR